MKQFPVDQEIVLPMKGNMYTVRLTTEDTCKNQGHSQDFSKGGGGGSHCIKHYHHGIFTTEYCRLFA